MEYISNLNKPTKLIRWILILFFIATPLDYILPHIGSATVLLVLGFAISALCVFDLLFFNSRMNITTENALLVFLCFFALVSLLWASNYLRARSQLISLIAVAAMYFMLFLYKFSKEEIKLFETASIIGGALMVLYVFTQVDLGRVAAGYRLDFDNIIESDEADFSDPNGLSARLIMPLVFCFKKVFEEKSIAVKAACIAIFGGIIYIMFLTGSRAAVVTLASVVFIILFKNLTGKYAGTALIIGFGAFFALLIFPDLLPEHIYNRIFNFAKYQEVVTYEGDRIDIWKNVLTKVFPESPLFGYGIGNAPEALRSVYGRIKAVHNSWLVILVDLGLIGFVPWMMFVYYKFKRAFKLRSKNIYPFVTLLGAFLMATTLDSHLEKYLWNSFLYVHMVYTMYLSESEHGRQTHEEALKR